MLLAVGAVSAVATCLLALKDWNDHKIRKQGQQRKKKFETIKFVLTGGPCGGKSQGINTIYYFFKHIAAPVFIVPEAATIIGTAGLTLDLSQFQPRQIELFQIYLMRLQYNLEQNVLAVARILQKLQKTPIVLCDRGLLDGKAYAGDENWAKMLKEINITQQDILDRYKAVIHMVTAAKGAPFHYNYTTEQDKVKEDNQEGNQGLKVRRQTPQAAVDLDTKLQNCYINHRNRFVISNEFFVKTFEDKKTVLLAQVYQILSQILKNNDLQEYYSDHQTGVRKNSGDDFIASAYLIRKRKYQRFLRKREGASPSHPASPRKQLKE